MPEVVDTISVLVKDGHTDGTSINNTRKDLL